MRKRLRIDLGDYKSIVFLTGAGMSAGSGIRTYRGPGGLWNDESLAKYSELDTFRKDPLAVWRFMSETRRLCAMAKPNPGHEALAEFEARLGAEQSMTVITQNIDGLHRRAGSSRLIEFHGSVMRSRCSDHRCGLPAFEDGALYTEAVPSCPRCGAPLRPDIVFFGEIIPAGRGAAALKALAGCELFVAVGTSASVFPASRFGEWAWKKNARTVFVNVESLRDRNHESATWFREEYIGTAESILPKLFGDGLDMDELQAYRPELMEELPEARDS
jgi:NAD-dependent deacetylase